LGGDAARQKVFTCIDKENSPRSFPFELELIKASGSSRYDVLQTLF